MSWLSSAVRKIAAPIATVAPFTGPTGQIVGAVAGVVAVDTAKKKQKEQQAIAEKQFNERFNNMDPYLRGYSGGISTTSAPGVATQNAGFGSSFGNFLDSFNRNVLTPGVNFAGNVRNLFGGGSRPVSASQGSAVTTVTSTGAQETQGSSTMNAGLIPGFANLGSRALGLLRTPQGQLALGGGAALSLMGGSSGSQRRITRKMKSQARQVLNITNGDLGAAADILNISTDELVFVLLKRFRNDGPMVSKAAVRKTRKTIRKLHMMKGILDEVSKKTSTRRRTGSTFSRKGTITSRI